MDIASRKECIRFLCDFEMPEHIRRHSFLVAEVALFIGRHLNQNGTKLNLRLVEAAALLHDVGKQRALEIGSDHARLGAQMLSGLVHPEVAGIVEEHVFLDVSQLSGPLTESLLVNYSDQRVKHDLIVSVEERYHDLIARYSRSPANREFLLQKLGLYLELERKIFSHLPFAPVGKEIMSITSE